MEKSNVEKVAEEMFLLKNKKREPIFLCTQSKTKKP